MDQPQPTPPNATPEPKAYSLKEIESQFLTIMRNNQNAVFSGYLSTIAIERLGYKVTPRSQFILNEDLTEIKIQELPDDVPVAPAPEAPQPPAEEPKSGAVAAK